MPLFSSSCPDGFKVRRADAVIAIDISGGSIFTDAKDARKLAHDLLAAVDDPVPVAVKPWVIDDRYNPRTGIREAGGPIVGFASSPEEAIRLVHAYNRAIGELPPLVTPPTPPPTPAAGKPWKTDGYYVSTLAGEKVLTLSSVADCANVVRVHNEAIGYTPPPAKDWAQLAAEELLNQGLAYHVSQVATSLRKHIPTS